MNPIIEPFQQTETCVKIGGISYINLAVPGRLELDAGERRAGLLGLDHARGPAVDKEHVIGKTMPGSERELADRDPREASRFASAMSSTAQPDSVRARSIDWRAVASGAGMGSSFRQFRRRARRLRSQMN